MFPRGSVQLQTQRAVITRVLQHALLMPILKFSILTAVFYAILLAFLTDAFRDCLWLTIITGDSIQGIQYFLF